MYAHACRRPYATYFINLRSLYDNSTEKKERERERKKTRQKVSEDRKSNGAGKYPWPGPSTGFTAACHANGHRRVEKTTESEPTIFSLSLSPCFSFCGSVLLSSLRPLRSALSGTIKMKFTMHHVRIHQAPLVYSVGSKT